ncbi:MAG: lycopene cyclase domain-containing protein [Flavobacteriales bacterium]
MNSHYTYLIVNLCCLIVPLIFSFHPKIRFYRIWKSFAAGALFMMLLFIPWDVFFTSQGIWGFNEQYIIGKKMIGLPVEEWLFFICIPYACCFTYWCMKLFVRSGINGPWWLLSVSAVAVGFITIACLHWGRWYTFTAHLLCGLTLLAHVWILRSEYLRTFSIMFIIILVPFVAANGVLTGLSFWQYPLLNADVENVKDMVVWYNNAHNLQLRICSMPLDDVSYGMLMLLLTITGFEWHLKREARGLNTARTT